MSTKYDDGTDIPTSVICERLSELSKAVADRRMDEFTMRIPAELDRDADLVLSIAAHRLKELQEKYDSAVRNHDPYAHDAR